MQGISSFIPTPTKIDYINQLLRVGFDTIDFGSFVSPKAIPQMRDTAEVLNGLRLDRTSSKLLAIVANLRGAEDACRFDEVTFLGFPLSLSETFQHRNTNKSIGEALHTLESIQNLCVIQAKTLVTYLSMGFGNPYGDPYEPSLVAEFVDKLHSRGIAVISLADTVGVATPETIKALFTEIIPRYPAIEFGAHLHSSRDTAPEKIQAVFASGCRRIDGALKGIGGCPMANDELVGNIDTEQVVAFLREQAEPVGLSHTELARASEMSLQVFGLV